MFDSTDQITLDPELAHGPVKNRKCTDVLCLLLFLGTIGFSIFVSFHGFTNGNPSKLFRLTDNSGNTCGEANTPTAEYPFLYFMDSTRLNYTLCVAECPDFNKTGKPSALKCHPNKLSADCRTLASNGKNIDIYDSVLFAEKACIPSGSSTFANNFLDKISGVLKIPKVHQFYDDLYTIRWILLAVPVVAIVFGSIYMVILRTFTGLIVWGTVLFAEAALVALAFFSFDYQANPKNYIEKFRLLELIPEDYVRYTSYAAASTAVVGALVILIFRSRINLTIGVLRCSTRFVSDMPSVVLLPPLFFIVDMIYVAYWCFSGAYLFTTGTIHPDPDGYPIKEVEWDSFTEKALYFHLFSGLWGLFFLLALNEFVVGFMTCMWYFSHDKKKASEGALSRAIGVAFFYHLGSIAFGALILGTLSFLQIIWEFVQRRMKNVEQHSFLLRCFMKCISFVFITLIGFVKYLNKHVYLEIAMTGEGFIGSAKDSFLLMMKNGARFGFVHFLGSLFVFLGEMTITVLTTVAGYYYIMGVEEIHKGINNPLMPMAAIAVFGYIVGSNFMKVYGTAADGIVHCFCLDEELKADSGFTPEELKDLIAKRAEIKGAEAEAKKTQ